MDTPFQGWFLERRRSVCGTQARAAYAIGTTEKTVREWEQGTPPRLRWAPKIAAAFDADGQEVAAMITEAHLLKAAAEASDDRVDAGALDQALTEVAEDVRDAQRPAPEPSREQGP